MIEKLSEYKAQMTVELAVVFPVLIIVAVVMVNALSFAGECARFDRVARNSLRCENATPSIDENAESALSRTRETLTADFASDNESVNVNVAGENWSNVELECELLWRPTLFGMGLKSEVFGVHMFELTHKTNLTIDTHRAGDVF